MPTFETIFATKFWAWFPKLHYNHPKLHSAAGLSESLIQSEDFFLGGGGGRPTEPLIVYCGCGLNLGCEDMPLVHIKLSPAQFPGCIILPSRKLGK